MPSKANSLCLAYLLISTVRSFSPLLASCLFDQIIILAGNLHELYFAQQLKAVQSRLVELVQGDGGAWRLVIHVDLLTVARVQVHLAWLGGRLLHFQILNHSLSGGLI